eukprot:gene6153-16756_t
MLGAGDAADPPAAPALAASLAVAAGAQPAEQQPDGAAVRFPNRLASRSNTRSRREWLVGAQAWFELAGLQPPGFVTRTGTAWDRRGAAHNKGTIAAWQSFFDALQPEVRAVAFRTPDDGVDDDDDDDGPPPGLGEFGVEGLAQRSPSPHAPALAPALEQRIGELEGMVGRLSMSIDRHVDELKRGRGSPTGSTPQQQHPAQPAAPPDPVPAPFGAPQLWSAEAWQEASSGWRGSPSSVQAVGVAICDAALAVVGQSADLRVAEALLSLQGALHAAAAAPSMAPPTPPPTGAPPAPVPPGATPPTAAPTGRPAAPGGWFTAKSGRSYDMSQPPPRSCYTCGQMHWYHQCPYGARSPPSVQQFTQFPQSQRGTQHQQQFHATQQYQPQQQYQPHHQYQPQQPHPQSYLPQTYAV